MKSNLRTMSRADLVPLVDVVFQLVVFFVLTGSLSVATGIPVNAPEAASGEALPTIPLEIVLAADGMLSVDGNRLQLNELVAYLDDRAPDAAVFISADRDVDYGRFVAVMDELRIGGYSDIGLRTQEQQGER